ncbi:hypothetical protein Acr_25g0006940 [Actinidia rufa]|uniref:Reverse transcriptase domain-containing protein n=1 Tax=Actinidia rufa TaxID=165716 RepID=A0A7J0GZL6_9ERIC|nr:hypothetical protein Acr_25g0006940 [Actinidia rufa]
MIISSWNIRGLNLPLSKNGVLNHLRKVRPAIMGLIETKLKKQSLDKLARNKLWNWRIADNLCHHPNGRIIVIWKEDLVALDIVEASDQAIHCLATCKSTTTTFSISFIYAFNSPVGRRSLWENLRRFSSTHHNPWILLGDFNNVLSNEERANRQPAAMYEIRDFKDCCYDLGRSDLGSTGAFFTWTNNSVWSKLDRAMVNHEWVQKGISAHSLVRNSWGMRVDGTAMYKLCRKLKVLKEPLKSLNNLHFSHISARSLAAKEELQQAQLQLHDNPSDTHLQSVIPKLRAKAINLAKAEMSYCSQLAKANFLKNCDKGTKFFHNMIKSRRMNGNIPSITLEDGSRSTSNRQVSDAFVQHYIELLGTKRQCMGFNPDIVSRGRKLEADQVIALTLPVSEEDVKSALFSIGEDKAPGPDGFSSCFFKKAWDIVGSDFTTAVLEFFSSGQILKQINHSVLALIPKSTNVERVEDFRPIACCNVIYKLISKIIAIRLAPALISIIDPAQAAFIQNRAMIDNIFLLQELLRQYSRKRSSPRSLGDLKHNPDFNFHLRCGGLKISHLAYADDLVLFSRGDPTSVSLIMDKLNHFGDCSGLSINLTKSSFYLAGVSNTDIEIIKGVTGFSQGSFPFRYLGIPVADSRLNIAQYSPLIDKISYNLSAWAGATLSYAGRTELIKSVLQGSGKCTTNKRPLVAWKEVTLPKVEGGLGLRDSKAWNKALLSRTLWDIQAKKETLWVQWVHQRYMKGCCFGEYMTKHEDSPLIKQVISLRDGIIQAETSVERTITRVNQWASDGKFHSKLAYEFFRPRSAKITWPKFVWHAPIIPRHSFILWLGLKDRLLTKNKLQRSIDDLSCPLCRAENETLDHLFFHCRIGNQIGANVKSWLGISRAIHTLKAAVKWMIKEARGTGFPAKIKRIALACTVYYIWEARNKSLFEGKIVQPEAISRRIQIQTYGIVYSLFPDYSL